MRQKQFPPPILPLPQQHRAPGEPQLLICKTPRWGSTQAGDSDTQYHQDIKASHHWLHPNSPPPPPLQARLHLHSACPQTKFCLLGPPPASAVALARQVNNLKIYLKLHWSLVTAKEKQCPIVLHSPYPSCFQKALGQRWGWGGEEKTQLRGNSWLDSGKADQTSASNKRHLHISHLFFIIYRSNLPKFSKGE